MAIDPNASPGPYSIPPKRRTPRLASLAIVLLFLALLVPIFFSSSGGYGQERAYRVKCVSNLRQLCLFCTMYANDHTGQFPDDLSDLIRQEPTLGISNTLICPSSTDTLPGPTTQDVLTNLHQPGHCSYIYLGKGLTLKSPGNAIVFYEPLANHDHDKSLEPGMNVVCVDGHAQWITKLESTRVLDQIATGQHPVCLPDGILRSH